jgi:hypothetical protein
MNVPIEKPGKYRVSIKCIGPSTLSLQCLTLSNNEECKEWRRSISQKEGKTIYTFENVFSVYEGKYTELEKIQIISRKIVAK